MNPLGQMPATASTRFSLSALDWFKILRFLIIQIVGLFLTYALPHLTSMTYSWGGVDHTADVLLAVNILAELGRRFLAGQPKG
jgi:hypothetical protein